MLDARRKFAEEKFMFGSAYEMVGFSRDDSIVENSDDSSDDSDSDEIEGRKPIKCN